jgi:hypothetical protein
MSHSMEDDASLSAENDERNEELLLSESRKRVGTKNGIFIILGMVQGWAQLGSNQRPISYEPTALTTELWALAKRIVSYRESLVKGVRTQLCTLNTSPLATAEQMLPPCLPATCVIIAVVTHNVRTFYSWFGYCVSITIITQREEFTERKRATFLHMFRPCCMCSLTIHNSQNLSLLPQSGDRLSSL